MCVGGGSPPGSGEARVAGSGARLRSPGAALGEEPPPVSPPPAAPRGGGPEPGKLLPCRRGAARPWRSPAAGAGRWGGGAVRGGEGRAGSGERGAGAVRAPSGNSVSFPRLAAGSYGGRKGRKCGSAVGCFSRCFFFFFLEERTLRRIH